MQSLASRGRPHEHNSKTITYNHAKNVSSNFLKIHANYTIFCGLQFEKKKHFLYVFIVNGAIVTLKTKIFANGSSIHLRQDFLSIGKELTDFYLKNKTSKDPNTIMKNKIKVSFNQFLILLSILILYLNLNCVDDSS